MSAVDELREAAAKMRALAEAAFRDGARDLWADMRTMDPDNNGWIVCEQRQADVDWDTTVARTPYDYEGHTARHIAGWHPVVALAVADWLDMCVRILGSYGPNADSPWVAPHTQAALKVARAFLGRVEAPQSDEEGEMAPGTVREAERGSEPFFARIRSMTDDPAIIAAVDATENEARQ